MVKSDNEELAFSWIMMKEVGMWIMNDSMDISPEVRLKKYLGNISELKSIKLKISLFKE